LWEKQPLGLFGRQEGLQWFQRRPIAYSGKGSLFLIANRPDESIHYDITGTDGTNVQELCDGWRRITQDGRGMESSLKTSMHAGLDHGGGTT
jgi:hypothetical protein